MKQLIKLLVYNFTVLLSLLPLANCTNKKSSFVKRVIAMDDLKKATLDSNQPYVSVQILKTFPIKMDCTANVHYANLCICKKRLTKPDTLYVFDECSKVPGFAINTNMNVEVGFYVRDTLKAPPKQVTVFVSKQFQMPKNAKYVFVSLISVDDG